MHLTFILQSYMKSLNELLFLLSVKCFVLPEKFTIFLRYARYTLTISIVLRIDFYKNALKLPLNTLWQIISLNYYEYFFKVERIAFYTENSCHIHSLTHMYILHGYNKWVNDLSFTVVIACFKKKGIWVSYVLYCMLWYS